MKFERHHDMDFLDMLAQRTSKPYAEYFNEDDKTKVDAAFRIILEHVCALVLAISEGWTSDEIEQHLGDTVTRLFSVLQGKLKFDGSVLDFVEEAVECVAWLNPDVRASTQTISKVLQKFEIDFEVKHGETLKRLTEEVNRIRVAADAEWILFKTIEQYKKEYKNEVTLNSTEDKWEFTETLRIIRSKGERGRERGTKRARSRNETESPPPKKREIIRKASLIPKIKKEHNIAFNSDT